VTQRADAAQRVEAQVQEVSQIFGRVADLIKDQGESVERIEVNVESAAADVEAAEGELMERLDNMGGNLVIGLKVGGIVLATMVAYVILV
jgi:syntaxin 5